MFLVQNETRITSVLNEDGIHQLLGAYEDICVEAKIHPKQAMLMSICLDGILREFAERFGGDTAADFVYGKRFGRYYAYVTVAGDEFNPIDVMDERDGTLMSKQTVAALDIYPSYSRKHGANVIQLPFPRIKFSDITKVFAAIFFGIIVGFVLRNVSDAVSAPIMTLFNAVSGVISGLIAMTIGPVVLLSVVTSISDIGSAKNFGRFGARVFGRFTLFMLLAAIVGISASILLFRPTQVNAATGSGAFDTIIDTLVSVFPTDIVSPFMNGYYAQIVVIAITFGVALLTNGERSRSLNESLCALSNCFMTMLEFFVSLLPVVVFITVAKLIRENLIGQLLGTWRVIVVVTLCCLLMLLIEFVLAAAKHRLSPLKLFRNVLSAEIIGHTTASACAAMYKMREIALDRYHCPESVVNFVLPMGIVCYGPPAPILLCSLSVYAASVCGTPVNTQWLILALIIITLMSMFTPPVPGGFIAVVMIIFRSLGLPQELADVYIPLLIVTDYIVTGFKVGDITLSCIYFGANKEKT